MSTNNHRGSAIFGALLLAAGIVFLLGQILEPIGIGYLWPVVLIVFGLSFFPIMFLGGRKFNFLAIPGAIIAGIGAILFIQNAFLLWETWTYAWALIIFAVGVGMFIAGAWGQDSRLRCNGLHVAHVGLTLFIIFGLIFEGIFSISGAPLAGGIFWPAALVLVGLAQLVIRVYRLFQPQDEYRRFETNLFWPIILIGAGVMWYMARLELLPGANIFALLNLWPILLIAAGVNLLIGRQWQWVNLLFGVVVVLGAFFVVYNHERLGLADKSPLGFFTNNFVSNQSVAQWVKGSGEIVEQTQSIGDVKEITLHGSGELTILQGDTPKLVISAEENLLQYIETRESGDRLTIGVRRGIGISNTRPIRYTVTVKHISDIILSGAATVTSENLTADTLKVQLSGFGDLTFKNLAARDLWLAISGSGNVKVDGELTNELNLEISGAGNFEGSNLKTPTANLELSGVGRAAVWVTERLMAKISGVGGVSYYGSPEVTKSTSGLGDIRQVGEK